MAHNVLIIDNETELIDVVSGVFKQHNFKVFKTTDGDEGIAIAKDNDIELVLLAVELPKKMVILYVKTLNLIKS